MSNTLQDRLAQAMRDRNSPNAWVSPQLVPFDHFAAVALEEFAAWLRSDEVEAVLVAHQRMDSSRCLCGWGELGRSHCRHVADALARAVADTPPSL